MSVSRKSRDYDVRAAVVAALLSGGIERGDIRHELTLDTNSSGGRADLVLLRNNRLIGFELKSGSDVLDRCDEQCRAMDRAFDAYVVVADIEIVRKRPDRNSDHWIYFRHGDKRFTRYPEQLGSCAGYWTPFDLMWLDAWPYRTASQGTAPMAMAATLWAEELCPLTGSRTRQKALEVVREQFALRDVRKHTVAQLRARGLSKWEEAFWTRYDAAALATEGKAA